MSSTESNMEVEDEEEELLLKVPESDISVDEGEEEELLKEDKETSKSKHALKKSSWFNENIEERNTTV